MSGREGTHRPRACISSVRFLRPEGKSCLSVRAGAGVSEHGGEGERGAGTGEDGAVGGAVLLCPAVVEVDVVVAEVCEAEGLYEAGCLEDDGLVDGALGGAGVSGAATVGRGDGIRTW